MTKSTKELKELVQEIRKLADPFKGSFKPGPAPATAPSPYAPNDPKGGFHTELGTSSMEAASVKAMQAELIRLANSVIEEIGTAQIAPAPGQAGVSNTQTQAASRTSFSDFITKHYARKSDKVPVEFDPSHSKTQMKDKRPSQATRMNVVMDTMRRVGGPKKELHVDGNWGPRTNAALHNAYALAYALISMSTDFGMTPKSYTEAQLTALNPLIPENEKEVSGDDKMEVAKEITAHLKSIERLFQEVKVGILQNPQYQSFIEGDDAFATYKKVQSQLTPQQMQSIKQSFASGFSVPLDQKNTTSEQFSVDDIMSPDALNKKIADIERTRKVKLDPYNTLTLINDQIGRQIRSI